MPTKVNCPDYIDLPGKNGSKMKYQLNSVLCHLGESIHDGHYVTCHRRIQHRDWLVYNDDVKVQPANTIRGDAYVCLYTIMTEQICEARVSV